MSSPSPLMGKSGSYNVPGGTKTRAMYPEATVISGVARYAATIGSWCSAIHTSLGKTGLSHNPALIVTANRSFFFKLFHSLAQCTDLSFQSNKAPQSPESYSTDGRQPEPRKFFEPHMSSLIWDKGSRDLQENKI